MSRLIPIDHAPAGGPAHLCMSVANVRRFAQELDSAPVLALRHLLATDDTIVSIRLHILHAVLWACLCRPRADDPERDQWAGLSHDEVDAWMEQVAAAYPTLEVAQFVLADKVFQAAEQAHVIPPRTLGQEAEPARPLPVADADRA